MGIFDKIKSAIWGEKKETAEAQKPVSGGSEPVVASAAPAPSAPASSSSPAPASPASTSAPAATTPAAGEVDIAAIMDAAVKRNGQKLNWRTSIVDLMKALGMESSLAERKELAAELGYTGDAGDSAAMNMWLHKAVLQKLKDNGGKLPADLH